MTLPITPAEQAAELAYRLVLAQRVSETCALAILLAPSPALDAWGKALGLRRPEPRGVEGRKG